jgi:cytochrome P450
MNPAEPVIRHKPGSRYPDGPTFFARALAGDLFRLNPLPFLTESAQKYGDLFHMRAAGRHVFQANHPDLVQELLLTDAHHHHRGIVMQKSQLVLGQGLLSSEDPHHMRQRRLAQPAFHRDRIAAYGHTIGDYAEQLTATWSDGATRDLHADMQLLSLRIVGKTMFNSELASVNGSIASAIDAFMGFLPIAFLPRSDLIYRLPLPLMNRIRQSRRDLDSLIYGLIAERRADGQDRGDLLSMLMASQDTEGGTGSMSDEQVRDECVTALLAGNETTANGLSFALWFIAQHPEFQARLQAEASDVLGSPTLSSQALGSQALNSHSLSSRTATAADYPALPFAHACFAEAMRLYPPVWTIARTAAEEYTWRGFRVPRGSILLAPSGFCTVTRVSGPSRTCFGPSASSTAYPPFREPAKGRTALASPTSPSPPAAASASAKASPGWKASSSSPPSPATGPLPRRPARPPAYASIPRSPSAPRTASPSRQFTVQRRPERSHYGSYWRETY